MNIPKSDRFYKGGPDLPYCIVGDEAFPLKSYLLRPYSGKNNLTDEQSIFNYRLSRASRVIENSFGILASQWRVYRKPIISSVETAMKIVQGTQAVINAFPKKVRRVPDTRVASRCSSRMIVKSDLSDWLDLVIMRDEYLDATRMSRTRLTLLGKALMTACVLIILINYINVIYFISNITCTNFLNNMNLMNNNKNKRNH